MVRHLWNTGLGFRKYLSDKTLSENDRNLGLQMLSSLQYMERRNQYIQLPNLGSEELDSSAVYPYTVSFWQVTAGSGRNPMKAMFGPGSKPEVGRRYGGSNW